MTISTIILQHTCIHFLYERDCYYVITIYILFQICSKCPALREDSQVFQFCKKVNSSQTMFINQSCCLNKTLEYSDIIGWEFSKFYCYCKFGDGLKIVLEILLEVNLNFQVECGLPLNFPAYMPRLGHTCLHVMYSLISCVSLSAAQASLYSSNWVFKWFAFFFFFLGLSLYMSPQLFLAFSSPLRKTGRVLLSFWN